MINDLERNDATDLLSEFGKDPIALDALFVVLADNDQRVRFSARYALYKLFKDNSAVCELLDFKKFFSSSHDERVETTKRIKEMLQN
jgi:HEAT repeat protein